MRMKQAAEKKTGSPLKKTVGPDSSPKPASPMSGKKNARGTKTMDKAVKKRKADIELNGYNADESDSAVESPIKKVKVEPAAWDSEEEQVSF
ncbi:hypothetical protein FH972_022385 [Carpinus fangiana]|uniref:Uncharacterized protein n=1 Tax=Carpinus fangiana TaxID=176857 RepID=A0A5N6KS48_9ROSI|nr:hypothetical protein FH972_022385 [Carpinus fangiana]